jgi:putative tryptophan/tyrosine transport system substrate-binding protein
MAPSASWRCGKAPARAVAGTMMAARHRREGENSDMRRREFILLLGGAAAWPLAARPQQPERMRRIGVLMGRAESDQEGQSYAAAFLRGLAALGWMPGRNLEIDYRWQAGDIGQAQAFANELVELRPDPLVANSTASLSPMHQVTRTIPIVG